MKQTRFNDNKTSILVVGVVVVVVVVVVDGVGLIVTAKEKITLVTHISV